MNEEQRKEIRADFRKAVSMSPSELEAWLETEESKSVGVSGGGESVGHRSGQRILEIKGKTVDELGAADDEHTQEVVGYVHRQLALNAQWRGDRNELALFAGEWGHDLLKD